MTCKLNADTSDGLKFVSDTSGAIDFQSNGTTKVSLDSSGNLEVNNGNFTIDKSSTPNLLFKINGTEKGYIRQNSDDLEFNCSSGSTLFRAGGTEHERITPAGKHLFGSTSVESTAEDNMQISSDGGNIYMYQHTTSLQGVIDFRNPNGYIGSIRTTGSSTQFNTSSDYRMKSNINYTWTATDTVKALQPCTFTFNGDTDTTCYGFIAHELQEHIPQAVSGVKDAVKTDGNGDEIIDPQGVDLGKIVPFLVKTIQELEARITTLENN